MIAPAPVISNIPKGSIPPSWDTPSTRRLVDVPISVVVPPRIAAKDSGMRSFDGATPIVLASLIATGLSITTTGGVLMNADSVMTPSIMAIMARVAELFSARREMLRPAASITPVRSSAADRTNIAAIVIGAELEKTASVSRTSRIPDASKAAMARRAITSGGSRSRTNARNTATTRTRTMVIWKVEFTNTSMRFDPPYLSGRETTTLLSVGKNSLCGKSVVRVAGVFGRNGAGPAR